MNATEIQYLTHTWNPVKMRCKRVSEGCENCWHLTICDRLKRNPALSEEKRRAFAGEVDPFIDMDELDAPRKRRIPSIIGVQFMGDLFYEGNSPSMINTVFATMLLARQHTFLVLTKRPERMVELYQHWWSWDNAPKHIWLGITAENQARFEERFQHLVKVPSRVKFISAEPLLGPINLGWWQWYIDWVITGCESGPDRRYAHWDWFRELRDQCKHPRLKQIPFFFKQGERLSGHIQSMPMLDGTVWDQFPEGVSHANL